MATLAPLDRPLTVADLADLPDDGTRYELMWGELFMSPSPGLKHQRVSGELYARLRSFVISNNSGEVLSAPMDVHLDDFNVVQPDLLVIATDSKATTEERGIIGPPELVLEILSSGSRGRDLVKKAVLYSRFGVPEYWIIDPDRKWILVYVLRGDRYEQVESADRVARSSIFSGLEVVPAELFAGIE